MVDIDPNRKCFTSKAVCDLLNISRKNIVKWENLKIIPCTKEGFQRRFSLNDIKHIEWIIYMKRELKLSSQSIAIIAHLMYKVNVSPDNLKDHTILVLKEFERSGRVEKSKRRKKHAPVELEKIAIEAANALKQISVVSKATAEEWDNE